MKEGLHTPFTEKERELVKSLENSQILKMVTPEGTFPMIDTGFEDDGDDYNLSFS